MSMSEMDFDFNLLPPGFRFHPTDVELVQEYLIRKCAGLPLACSIIAEVDLYKFDPWNLPEMVRYGEKEWYFFSPRDRKYPNGQRPNRAAGSGFWKATGQDKPIGQPETAGIKKALVFYAGKPPHIIKTNWIMHEYRLANVDRSASNGNKNPLRLDEWVLCRIYNKKGIIEKYPVIEPSGSEAQKMDKEKEPQVSPPPSGVQQVCPQPTNNWPESSEVHMAESSEPVPIQLHPDSSGSEQVNSPEFMYSKEDLVKEIEYCMEDLFGDEELFETHTHTQSQSQQDHVDINQFFPLHEVLPSPPPNAAQKPF